MIQTEEGVGQRLKKAREKASMSQNKLARRADMNPSTISRAERGETVPSDRTLEAIADALHVSVDWLIRGKGSMNNEDSHPVTEAPEPTDKERKLPILDLNAQAGNGGYIVNESPIGYMTPDKHSPFYEVRRGSRSVYYIPVRGNSMYPTLKRGELVPVRRFEPSVQMIREDDIYVFRWDSHTYVKRLQKMAKHRLKVISDNEAYDPQYIELDDGVDFEVLGQVLV